MPQTRAPGRIYLRIVGVWCLLAGLLTVFTSLMGLAIAESTLWMLYNFVTFSVAALYFFTGIMALKYSGVLEQANTLRTFAFLNIGIEVFFFAFNVLALGISAVGITLLLGLIRPFVYLYGATKNKNAIPHISDDSTIE